MQRQMFNLTPATTGEVMRLRALLQPPEQVQTPIYGMCWQVFQAEMTTKAT